MASVQTQRIDIKRIGYHILFWVVITVGYDLFSVVARGGALGKTLLVDFLFYTPTDILCVYVVLYLLIPRFLLTKKYILFSTLSVIWIAVMVVFIAIPFQYMGLTEVLDYKAIIPDFYPFFKRNIVEIVTLKFMITGIAAAIKISKVWLVSQKRQQKLFTEKLETELKLREAELKFLKSQINPHFLFNALNNLYSLTLTKSDKAPEVVLKISALLDYVLYECNVPLIELERELESIRNYIDLQTIRYGTKTNISFKTSGQTASCRIAPLLILPLVENAFKHGLDKTIGSGYVDIITDVSDNELKVSVKNTLNGENNHEGEGIGIKNLRKRLELQYPGKFTFELTQTETEFQAYLSILTT